MSLANEFINLDIVKELKAEAESSGEWTKLAETLASVFSHSDYLGSSFLLSAPLKERCPVDKTQAKETFEVISECPIILITTVLERSKRLLHSITRNNKDTNANHTINTIVTLFQNPLFLQNQKESTLLPDICECIAVLENKEQDILCRYLTEPLTANDDNAMHTDLTKEHYSAQFKDILDVFQNLVCARLSSRTPSTTGLGPNSDSVVIDATKCIAALYRLNNERKYVSYVEFYNDAVNEQLEIKEDFPNFKDKKGFSFCDYPFMLNPAVKADVLKVESVFQMRHELQDAFFRALFQGVNSPYLVLEIRRDHIISDTLLQLEEKSIHDLKKQLRVQFLGEEGVDEGGVQKEFFQLIVREIFDPKYGMFTFNEESRLCWFTPNQVLDDINIREYKLVGLLLGLAVYNSVILDLHFPLALYKKLMDVPIGLSDLRQLDPSLGKGLERLLAFDGDTESEYDRFFQVDIQSFGHVFTCDLKQNGANTQLTNENRSEFVDLYTHFVLSKSVEKQFDAFREGFQLVCQDSAIKVHSRISDILRY
ncbi:unnamed protein product [Mucor hiemalis]